MNVGMTAVAAVNRLVDDAESGRRGLAQARAELDAVEHRPPEYGRWLVVVALGLTAASLSRLFGGDWPTFAVTWLAGAAGTWLRQELGRRHLNPIVIPFAAASLSGIIGGGVWADTPEIFDPRANTWTYVSGVNTSDIHDHEYALSYGLPDGRVFVLAASTGVVRIFDPAARTWTKVADMAYPRWYPTTTVLPDGRVLVVAGETNCDGCDVLIPEIYNPQTNTWVQLTNASLQFPYYPHMFVLPDGRVLAASATEESIISRALDVAAQTWSVVDPVPVDGGSAAMFLPGKVMKSGTSTNPDEPVVPAAATTYVLDATQPSPTWRQTASMSFPRAYHTLTILPDGNVLVTGGGPTTDAIGLNNAIKAAELWSPTTETWTTMASMQTPRLYHSTALLLPDARVLVAGGGRWTGSSPDPSDQLSAEIYSPPYLFKGARPVIGSAPAQMGYGGSITIQTPDAARIGAVALIKLGSVTHAFDMDQRFVPLSFTWGSDSLSVQTPLSANLAPPGDYMLFIVDTAGIPSVAAIVKVQ